MAFRNITDVERLGETPEAYVCRLEFGDGWDWQSVPYVARRGGGGMCDEVIEWIEANVPNPPLHVPTPVVERVVYSKALLFRGMTDTEYAQFEAGLALQPPRVRAIFQNATELWSDDEMFQDLKVDMTAVYGETRTQELLNGARI